MKVKNKKVQIAKLNNFHEKKAFSGNFLDIRDYNEKFSTIVDYNEKFSSFLNYHKKLFSLFSSGEISEKDYYDEIDRYGDFLIKQSVLDDSFFSGLISEIGFKELFPYLQKEGVNR